jgi:cytochrome P450
VLATGHLRDLIGDFPLFIPLAQYFERVGGVYKLSFAPVPQATFYVISDAAAVKHILKEKTFSFDKGLLAEILEPILGKGLIPADVETWKQRRPVVQPGFHQRWLQRMCITFNDCTGVLVSKLDAAEKEGKAVNMESLFNSVSLDIIGKAVFNYDFGSVTSESPVIKAAYACLKEAEHRSTFILPYWDVPVIGSGPLSVVPRQREFAMHLGVLNDKLDEMVTKARELKNEADLEALEKRDYSSMEDPSLLRFLVDLRGGDCDDKQLRDDLMTMLVAGHETTGSLLTWCAFELSQNKEEMNKLQEEIDRVLKGRDPSFDDIKDLHAVRAALSESLRLYPQPPILLRRALEDTELPLSHGGEDPASQVQGVMHERGVKLSKGANVFISVWNLHRNPLLWDNPTTFDPSRFTKPKAPFHDLTSWKGYTPRETPGMYPNEVDSDFAFIPFGGGQRKCVGDQFAMMEAVVILSKVLQRYDLELATKPEEVGMSTGATIHTRAGLNMYARKRKGIS